MGSRGLATGALLVALGVGAGAVALAGEDGGAAAPSDWANLPDVPLERRGEPLIAWTGQELVVLGGAVPGERGGTRWVGDGAVFDTARDAWEDLPAPPLGALADASAVWTGTELLVLGTPCEGELDDDASTEECEPGGVGLAALTPDGSEWRTLAVPDALRRAASAGWLHLEDRFGDEVLVAAGAERWLWEPDDGSVRSVPAPDLGLDGVCVGDERLLALDYRSGPVDPADQYAPNPVLTAATLDPGAARLGWSPPRGVPVADDAFEFASHGCAGDGALVVRHAVGGRQAVDHFDGSEWRPVPAAPLPLEVGGFTAWSGEQVLFWTGDPARPATKAIVAYDPGAGRWSIAGHTTEEPTKVVPADDRLVLFTFGAVTMSFASIEP